MNRLVMGMYWKAAHGQAFMIAYGTRQLEVNLVVASKNLSFKMVNSITACVCICVLYFLPGRPKCGHMAAVLKTTCRSICRASIYSGPAVAFSSMVQPCTVQ